MLRVAILAATLVAIGAFTGVSVASGGPMADAGLDQTVAVDTTVQLDGTGSGHPTGSLSAYEWTIRTPDGRTVEPDCVDCERSQFAPSMVGRYEVNLTVTGPDGARSTDTLFVYVEDAGPEVELSGNRTPDPNEPVTYTANAESAGAELEEVAWAVEDEIVAVRSLDGTSDESELSLAFSEEESHRVQVVVRDSNGRTAYDQLYVQPQSGSSGASGWGEVEPPDCSDSGYAASNPEECWDLDEPESTEADSEPDEPSEIDPFEVRYVTDGFESDMFAGMEYKDSNYVGQTIESVGLDGGENAPWNKDTFDRIYDETVDQGFTKLFGQEQETVTCEIQGAKEIPGACAQKVYELENGGETTNVYSPSESGSYAEYGLRGGERVSGKDPTDLEDGQHAEVTIIIQQEEDGIVDDTVEAVDSSKERIKDAIDGLRGDESDEGSRSTSSNRGDTERGTTRTTVGIRGGGLGGTGLISGSSPGSSSNSDPSTGGVTSSESSTAIDTSNSDELTQRTELGLVA